MIELINQSQTDQLEYRLWFLLIWWINLNLLGGVCSVFFLGGCWCDRGTLINHQTFPHITPKSHKSQPKKKPAQRWTCSVEKITNNFPLKSDCFVGGVASVFWLLRNIILSINKFTKHWQAMRNFFHRFLTRPKDV